MTTEKSLIDSAIRGWKSNVERADKLFGGLSSEQLEQEVAPGRNRLIYLWGHLAAANDGLLPLLGVGERLHPEFDAMFTSNPDKSIPLTVSGPSLKAAWQEIHQKLWGTVSRSSRPRTGRSGIPHCRKRISSGSRVEIDSRFCLEEPRTLPIEVLDCKLAH
jgi:hypothetical protein